MKHHLYEKAVADLFADERNKPEAIVWLLDKIHTNYVEVTKLSIKRFITLLAAWAITYAIASGVVEESQLSVIQVRKVIELLVIAPPILGMLAYDFLTHTMVGMVLIGVLRKYLGIVLPAATGTDLVQLLTPSTFFSAETLLSENTRSLSVVRVVWILAISVSFFLTGLVAVLHSIYLLWRSDVWHPLTVLVSAGVALMFAFMPLIFYPQNFPSRDAGEHVTEAK